MLGGLGVVVLVAVLVILYLRAQTPATETWVAQAGTGGVRTRPVTLYFGDPDGSGLVPEAREILAANDGERAIRHVVDELLRGPAGGGAVGLFDSRARVRSVFLDADGVLILDFAGMPFPEFASDRTCDLAVQSLMRVLIERTEPVSRVSLLVDGAPLAELENRLSIPLVIRPEAWLGSDFPPAS